MWPGAAAAAAVDRDRRVFVRVRPCAGRWAISQPSQSATAQRDQCLQRRRRHWVGDTAAIGSGVMNNGPVLSTANQTGSDGSYTYTVQGKILAGQVGQQHTVQYWESRRRCGNVPVKGACPGAEPLTQSSRTPRPAPRRPSFTPSA